MRGPRKREFSKAIRTRKLHGRTVVEVVGKAEKQTCSSGPGILGLSVTHALIGWCLEKLE